MVRAIESYRAARKNDDRESKAVMQYHPAFSPKEHRHSYLSKPPSKYMPHMNGNGYCETPKRERSTANPTVILAAWQRLNNKKRSNNKHKSWKKRRSSGLH